MKKLYLFFAMLFSLLGGTTLTAQSEVSITVDMNNGKWVEWNGVESNPYARTWNSITTPAISICCKNGTMSTTDIRGNNFSGANNMAAWGDGLKQLTFYNQFSSTGYGNYEIMVALGWYIKSVEFDFNSSVAEGTGVSLFEGEEVLSTGPEDTRHMEWTAEDDETFAVPFTIYQKGTNGFARTSNFHVVVAKQPEAVAALQELQAVLEEYEEYAEAFTPGTQPGQYAPEKVAAFKAAIQEAHEQAENPDLELSMSDLERAALYRQLAEDIKSAYEAVVASKVPMTLADGYYRIRSGLTYTNNVTDSETGEVSAVVLPKYLSTSKSGETVSAVWNTPDDVETYCPALFQVTNKNGAFDIRSAATDGRFNEDKPVTLTINGENLMALDAVATDEDGVTYVNIRQANTEANSGQIYLHCGGHASGAGVSGTLTLWYSTYVYEEKTAAASEWVFEPVSNEEAEAIIEAYEPIKELEMLVYNFNTTLADAKEKLAIARDIEIEVENDHPLITENSQFSSPWTETSEGSIEALIDEDASTYWHSAWSGGNVPNGTHYLQVEINEADVTTISNIAIQITRRPVVNDHVTLWGVFGTNDPDAEKEACEELAEISTPFGSNTETIVSDVFAIKGHKYLRFYINGTTTGRGYGHVSEFQIYPAKVNQSPTAQSIVLGEVFTNLENQVNALKNVDAEDVELEQYRELKAAYDAFIAKFVDPTPLRETLADVADAVDAIIVGTDPGFWNSTEGAGAFRTLYDEAVAYDAAGAYTTAQSEAYIEQLNNQTENIYSSANKIQTNKWYKIRFASTEEFEQYGWDKVAGNAQYNENIGMNTSEALFGKYITAATYKATKETYIDDSNQEQSVSVYEVEPREASELGLGNYLFFMNDEDNIYDKDLALFRFVEVGDSAFMLQNKGTNLFLRTAGTSGAVTLSVHPSLFNVRAIGYGQNLIASEGLTGENPSYLHAQVAANMLVTWNVASEGNDKAGWRSSFYIEEAEDVASDFEGTDFNLPVNYGALNAFCFPIELSANEGQMWGVSSVDTEANSITLMKMEKAVSGRPFIYIIGDLEDYDEEEEPELVSFSHGYTIDTTEPQADGLLRGTYESIVIDRGDVYFSGNQILVNSVEKDAIMVALTRVAANQAYIVAEGGLDPNGDLEVIWDETAADGIQTALQNISKSGAVYTIDGRLVSKKASLNDLQKFGKGIYILNGTKVVVK